EGWLCHCESAGVFWICSSESTEEI
ncbi:unnamed protein product, partial [Caretta caretta]